MFGHDDKDENQDNKTPVEDNVVQPMATTPPNENLMGVGSVSANDNSNQDEDINQIVDDINATTDDGTESMPDTATARPQHDDDNNEQPSTFNETPSELLAVKKGALQELSPLIDELDQTPEEKLNILMMTIQATDDQSLLSKALDSAKKIEDKKARAEAMLDIIQEINYFTKNKN